MRNTFAVAAVAAAAALLAVPAEAKDGVRAKLAHAVSLAPAGDATRTIAWRLIDEHGDEFKAGGIYLRVSRCGRAPLIVAARRSGGNYTARVKLPPRGLRKVIVGLEGWTTADGRTTRRDKFFQFDPPLARDCAQ
jgi:hypothetical protein